MSSIHIDPPPFIDIPRIPILDGPSPAFDVVRDLFIRAEYDEATVARRLGLTTLYGVPRIVEGRTTLTGPIEDANALLVRLFLDGDCCPIALAERLLGSDALGALQTLGLADTDLLEPPSLRATVMLVPTQGLWLASDRKPMPSDHPEPLTRQYVFSANNELTHEFLTGIPDARGARVLELCAGTGVAALRAVKRGAREAWATDVAERSVHFARFNARLNGVADRVTVVESDVWESLAGETFDLVVAHPPYVPALSHRFDFRDAGEDGEQVTRRLVQGLADHMRRGGRCVLRAALSDRTGAPIATRVRKWLGEAGAEFDLVVMEHGEYGPMEAYRSVTNGGKDFVDCERWLREFEALGISRFAVCMVEMRRDAYGRAPITERRVAGSTFDHRAMDWIFRWARFVAQAGDTAEARLAGQRARVVAGVRAAVHLQADAEAGWRNVGVAVETGWPTHLMVKAPPLAATLLELCDGTRDVPALLEGLRATGLVDRDVGASDVADLVETLAAAGALELPACPVPPMPA